MTGLMRKYYLFDPGSGKGGGCYHFEGQAAAEVVFNDAWWTLTKDKYGAKPKIQVSESPVVVDNVIDKIVGDVSGSA